MEMEMDISNLIHSSKRTTLRKNRRSQRSQRKSLKSKSSEVKLLSGDSGEIKLLESLISKGPVTIVLVFSPTCPHCVSYKPIWEQLCKVPGRKANMVSVESSVYQKTPLSQKKPVSSVPTVLYVDSEGKVSEAGSPRDTEVMTNAVKLLPGSDLPATLVSGSNNVDNVTPPATNPDSMDNVTVKNTMEVEDPLDDFERSGDPLTDLDNDLDFKPLAGAVVPGTRVSNNPLHPLPATVVPASKSSTKSTQAGFQQGGNPWAAFVLAAQQAAPAAALFGAYSLMPSVSSRSSGLGAPERKKRTSRKTKRSKVYKRVA